MNDVLRPFRHVLAAAALVVLPQDAAVQEAPVAATTPLYSQEQLEQMLAPLALYPDDLLAQVLMASTYPLEVVEADRWVKSHPDPQGEDAAAELAAEDWDASVKSLVNVPDVLAMLSERLEWTRQLGDAFLAQQDDVMRAVQSLRRRASDAGQLVSSEQQDAVVQGEGDGQIIEILAAQPDIIYVPVYNPTVVYAPWPWPAWPPYVYYPFGWTFGGFIGCPCFHPWAFAWGHCNWHALHIDIDIHKHAHLNPKAVQALDPRRFPGLVDGKGTWTHAPEHRAGVPYRDAATAQRFGGVTQEQAEAARRAWRGRLDGRTGPLTTPRNTPVTPSPPPGSLGGQSAPRPAPQPPARTSPRQAVPPPRMPPAGRPPREAPPPRISPFEGTQRGAQQTRRESARGRASRGGAPAASPPPQPRSPR